jgi:hypothetical protein
VTGLVQLQLRRALVAQLSRVPYRGVRRLVYSGEGLALLQSLSVEKTGSEGPAPCTVHLHAAQANTASGRLSREMQTNAAICVGLL